MAEIEYNQVKCRGVYPGYDMDSLRQYPRRPEGSTQIVATGAKTNGSSTVYTVTAGKTLYLCSYHATLRNESGAVNNGYARIVTSGAASWFFLHYGALADDVSENIFGTFNPALEVPENYYFQINSSAANFTTLLSIHGYEM